MTTKTAGRDLTAAIAFLTWALKAPTLRECVDRLAERARAESWSHEERSGTGRILIASASRGACVRFQAR